MHILAKLCIKLLLNKQKKAFPYQTRYRNACVSNTSLQTISSEKIAEEVRLLDLDLNLNTAGKLKLHQSINSLSSAAVDVDETLV